MRSLSLSNEAGKLRLARYANQLGRYGVHIFEQYRGKKPVWPILTRLLPGQCMIQAR